MNWEKITILFVINTNKINQKGLCPISCRITLNKARKQFATGLFVNPNYWENKLQKVTSQDANHKYINAQLERIQVKIYNITLVFQMQGIELKLADSFNEYKGVPLKKEEYMLSCYMKYVATIQKLLNIILNRKFYQIKLVSITF